jgi:hypothetical protein
MFGPQVPMNPLGSDARESKMLAQRTRDIGWLRTPVPAASAKEPDV